MRELEGVRDQGSPTQQAAPKTWSLAGWRHLQASRIDCLSGGVAGGLLLTFSAAIRALAAPLPCSRCISRALSIGMEICMSSLPACWVGWRSCAACPSRASMHMT